MALSVFKKMKSNLNTTLASVQSKSWAKPLGQAMSVTGQIVDKFGGFIPGASILTGALNVGAQLLNPDPKLEDLQKDLKEIRQLLESTQNRGLKQHLEAAKEDLLKKINPVYRYKVTKILHPMLNMMTCTIIQQANTRFMLRL